MKDEPYEPAPTWFQKIVNGLSLDMHIWWQHGFPPSEVLRMAMEAIGEYYDKVETEYHTRTATPGGSIYFLYWNNIDPAHRNSKVFSCYHAVKRASEQISMDSSALTVVPRAYAQPLAQSVDSAYYCQTVDWTLQHTTGTFPAAERQTS